MGHRSVRRILCVKRKVLRWEELKKSAAFTGSRAPCKTWSRMRTAFGGAWIALDARFRIQLVPGEGVGMGEGMDFFLVVMEGFVEDVCVAMEVLFDPVMALGMVDMEGGYSEEAVAEVV